MANWRFQLDHSGIAEYLRSDTELAAALHERCGPPLEFAKATAPVGSALDGDEHPGQYRDSLETGPPSVVSETIGGRPDSRFACTIGADVDYAKAVERKHHVLARTRAAFTDPKGGYGL